MRIARWRRWRSDPSLVQQVSSNLLGAPVPPSLIDRTRAFLVHMKSSWLDNPALYLNEKLFDVDHNVVVSPPTMCRIIRRHGFTRKKIQQIASQRCSEYRGDFMADSLCGLMNQDVTRETTETISASSVMA